MRKAHTTSPFETAMAAERRRIRPHVERLKALVRTFDPEARFTLSVGHVPEFWELDARVRREVAEDDSVRDVVADAQTDILVDHDVAITVLLLPRKEEAMV